MPISRYSLPEQMLWEHERKYDSVSGAYHKLRAMVLYQGANLQVCQYRYRTRPTTDAAQS